MINLSSKEFDNPNRQKMLGQYFSGEKISKLLFSLSEVKDLQNAIDPMCGSGDMLKTISNNSNSAALVGIEIDNVAYTKCLSWINNPDRTFIYNRNAFQWDTINSLPYYSYDFVMTNPPYVRYQNLASSNDEKILPDSQFIRSELLVILEKLPNMAPDDKNIFRQIIKGYSGLSDLAVASWILCAMLTKVGGVLAIVVPESWLSRDYAKPIHYMLLKLFKIKWVVEDTSRVWFKKEKAQVKTTLLIAERIKQVSDLYKYCKEHSYYHISLSSLSMNDKSIVGNLFPYSSNPENDFLNSIKELELGNDKLIPKNVTYKKILLVDKLNNLQSRSYKHNWFKVCEKNLSTKKAEAINVNILNRVTSSRFTTLDDLGVNVGQGLRTGANVFFYGTELSSCDEFTTIELSSTFSKKQIKVPTEVLKPVLRKQSEISKMFKIEAHELAGRVFILENYISRNDNFKIPNDLSGRLRLMKNDLNRYIETAENLNIGNQGSPKYIPNLSAVKTNILNSSKKDNSNPRFWYTLPRLKKRHFPDLFVPRVNNQHPKFILNVDMVVIDANFSTLWLSDDSKIDKFSLLAFLNSSWSILVMENIASIMGGGALKLEASHIRQIPIPNVSNEVWNSLSKLGEKLVNENEDNKIIKEIDLLLLSEIYSRNEVLNVYDEILKKKNNKLKERK